MKIRLGHAWRSRLNRRAQSVRDHAALVLAFGRATWPHMLVRVLLAEQIYRAQTKLSGIHIIVSDGGRRNHLRSRVAYGIESRPSCIGRSGPIDSVLTTVGNDFDT